MPTHIQRLAALARAAQDPTLPPSRTNDEARAKPAYAATMRLRGALVEELGTEEIANRIVSRWLITRQPILACIEQALEEPVGGWPDTPSQFGQMSGMAYPSQYVRPI